MNIAVIGTGNVGGALAAQWAAKGHSISLGVRDVASFKGKELLSRENIHAYNINDAVIKSDIILIATPPMAVVNMIDQLDSLEGKIIIDATNAVFQKLPDYSTVYHLLASKTKASLVKCFNTTGFENMMNPVYHGEPIDMFMAGDSEEAKVIARQLARDAGFGDCIDFGGSDKVALLEQFALSWINLAIMQGMGRNIAFRLVKR